MKRFANRVKAQQIAWALDSYGSDKLEKRSHESSWVLKAEYKELNLFDPCWWRHIAEAEHRWARALNSSQCFGLNLFSPLHEDQDCARRVLSQLIPERHIEVTDSVDIKFEYSPEGMKEHLGERGQPTQIDVAIEIRRGDQPVGFVLIEVKFTESGFGECRGWNGRRNGSWSNPDRGRCQNTDKLAKSAETQCWLVETEGRTYWDLISRISSSLDMSRISREGACPFRGGLYQLMRNRVMADELVHQSPGVWAEFVVCRHPGNDLLLGLEEPIAGRRDAIEAFRSLSSSDAVRDWNAEDFVETVAAAGTGLDEWRKWMRRRYFEMT